MSKGYVRIEYGLVRRDTICYRLTPSLLARKYFKSRYIFFHYPGLDLREISSSILAAPGIASIAPIIWVGGLKLYVDEIDSTLLEGLDKAREGFANLYPTVSFSGEIVPRVEVHNSVDKRGEGLLFSGGVDSMSSYILHQSSISTLAMVRGADVPLSGLRKWFLVKNVYSRFARRENVALRYVATNIRDAVNESYLNTVFGRLSMDGSWWGGFWHGIVLISTMAPITFADKIGTIYLASSAPRYRVYSWGSHPSIDEHIRWGNIKVVHDCVKYPRHLKVRYFIKRYIAETGRYLPIRSCWKKSRGLNCGRCEKCYRTMISLLIEGIDPAKVGFPIDSHTLRSLRRMIATKKFRIPRSLLETWLEILYFIPNTYSEIPDIYGSREFLYWLKRYSIIDIVETGRRPSIASFIKRYITSSIYPYVKTNSYGLLRNLGLILST